jgi:hypothetical protein
MIIIFDGFICEIMWIEKENENELKFGLTEIDMNENGKMVRKSENEPIFLLAEINMSENGKGISLNENEELHGQMEINLNENIRMMRWKNENLQ